MSLRLKDLNQIWGEPTFSSSNLNEVLGPVSTDSRSIIEGSFFIPLTGEIFDGHNFLEEVFLKGAQASLISSESNISVPSGLTFWTVPDTLRAYQQLALLYRSQFKIPHIAITGSVGKTTTRDLIEASLLSLGPILATENNNNNDIGVPFTLLQTRSVHMAVVVEMGMRGLGEIQRLSSCARPDIAVITNIGTAHLGRLGSRRNIAKAKLEIASSLNPNGALIIPAKEPLLEEILSSKWKGRVIRVEVLPETSINQHPKGINLWHEMPKADYSATVNSDQSVLYFNQQLFKLPFIGIHNARNFINAIAVSNELGVPLDTLKNLSIRQRMGRNKCVKMGQITILDETYNASPESVISSLELLVTKPGRHFAVIGTMMELGATSIELHCHVVKNAVELNLDGLVIFSSGPEGDEMYKIGSTLPYCSIKKDIHSIADDLNSILKPGDNLLLKASRSLGLERLLPLLKPTN